MIRLIGIIVTGIVTSLYYFPFEFLALPGVNTKMLLAVLGLVCVVFYMLKEKNLSMPKELLYLVALAAAVSLASLISITINQTPDTAYVNYIISFSVWLSGAFAVCTMIKVLHGRISVRLVLNYLVAVCFFQCLASLLIYNNPLLADFVNSHITFGQEVLFELRGMMRLYGLGSMLDIAGLRFSLVLIGIAFYLSELKYPLSFLERIVYILMFGVITVIGNIMSRTTMVGAGIGLVFVLMVVFVKANAFISQTRLSSLFTLAGTLSLVVVSCVILYNTDTTVRKFLRFGFEGFFSLAEKGEWEVSSNERLKTMIVFPETLHTWVIGDGYFENSRYDANYLGESTELGYYMGTDIGYLRFIFYCGLIGLIMMIGLILYSTIVCIRYFDKERWLFILALLAGLTIWFKVSTDIFCFLALFLSVAALKDPMMRESEKDMCVKGTD